MTKDLRSIVVREGFLDRMNRINRMKRGIYRKK